MLPRCSPGAPLLRPLAPLLLPLKRPCSLSRPGTAILDPKFGVYIIDIKYPRTEGNTRPDAESAPAALLPR